MPKIIAEKWEVQEERGQGGQAQVYIVTEIGDPHKRRYALKFLKSQKDIDRRRRMHYEVSNLNSLSHKHILNIIESNSEAYEGNDKLYYVCPFIEGCNLEEYVIANNISPEESLLFFRELCETVGYCHSQGIIHRDIKPDNIMISNDNLNEFVLIDFGLSFNKEEAQERATETNQQLGNRFLILPELVSGDVESKRLYQSDISQLCGVLIYTLTGIIPHSIVDGEGNPPHKRGKIKRAIEELRLDNVLFENLNCIFDRAFSVNVEDRYQSIPEIIADLHDLKEKKFNRLGGNIMAGYEIQLSTDSLPVLKYNELIRQLNPNPQALSPSGLRLPQVTNIEELMHYSVAIREIDQRKIVKYYQIGDFETAAEKVWPRSMALLRNSVLSLGEEFVSDMVGVDDLEYVQNLPDYKVIMLANDLGFIDKTGRNHLLRANEYYNHYVNPEKDDEEEMPMDEANIIIKNCVRYILYNSNTTYGLQFNDFREKLKTHKITEIFSGENMFATAPYFYLKTTVRSLIKLYKETEGIEHENIITNIKLIIPQIWTSLKTEEKRLIADTYTDYVNENDLEKAGTFKDVLSKIQGFDYVKENVRSREFITVARKLIDVHFSVNNFYNEPAAIQALEDLGTKFPGPALKECITATLYVKLGNAYSTSWDAEIIADRLLARLDEDEWSMYLNNYLQEEEVLCDSIHGSRKVPTMYRKWKEVIKKYNLSALRISDRNIQNMLA